MLPYSTIARDVCLSFLCARFIDIDAMRRVAVCCHFTSDCLASPPSADKYNYDDHAIQYNIFQMHQLGTHESHCSDVAICLYSFIDFEIVLIDFPLTDFKLVNVSSSADCQEMLSLSQWLNICAIFLSTANIALRNPWIPLDAHLVGAVIVCDAGIRRRFI